MAVILSRYFGTDRFADLEAHVTWDGRWYSVDMYHRGDLIERRPLRGRSEGDASDVAEDFVKDYYEFSC